MRHHPAGADRRRNERYFCKLLLRRAGFTRSRRMEFNAIWALRRQANRDCDQFLVFQRNDSGLERRLIKRDESFERLRRQFAESLKFQQFFHVVHGKPHSTFLRILAGDITRASFNATNGMHWANR